MADNSGDERDGRDAPADFWRGCSDASVHVLIDAILDVARELARQIPPPRGAPWYGLEYPAGDFAPLARFCARGIFRKYESVLDLGSGFGAAARWWSAHFGCRVVGVEPSTAIAAASAQLSDRARAASQTRFVNASLDAIPCRERLFTHVWCVERLEHPVEDDGRLREAFRVLRPGGQVALQLSDALPDWSARATAAMRATGFVELETHVVEHTALPESYRAARERLLNHLRRQRGLVAGEVAEWLAQLYDVRGAARTATQVFARRPAS